MHGRPLVPVPGDSVGYRVPGEETQPLYVSVATPDGGVNERKVLTPLSVPDPDAPANRPVPPTIHHWSFEVLFGQVSPLPWMYN
ncbi:MAG TPA: hypothetical protein VFB58_01890 [Chloroflexota bacterium]|nr:hypothetical protein [Chloroflexota bacterium]